MKDYVVMRINKTNEPVRVYAWLPNGEALCFVESEYAKQGAGGWRQIKTNKLRPDDIPVSEQYVSKTQQNKAKKRMKLIDATWETSDGKQWTHTDIEKAVAHEYNLMSEEQSKEGENQ